MTMKKCKYYKFYRALSPPTGSCQAPSKMCACEAKWLHACKVKKKKMAISGDCPDPEACENGCIGYCADIDEETEDVVDFMRRNS